MNPMPVVMYLMGLEAEHGLLTELGFAKRPHPEGSRLQPLPKGRGPPPLHRPLVPGGSLPPPQGALLPGSHPPYPPGVHPEAEPLDFAEGLAHFLPFLKAYEDAVAQLRGEGRERFLRRLPSGARRHLKDWKALFAGGTYAQGSQPFGLGPGLSPGLGPGCGDYPNPGQHRTGGGGEPAPGGERDPYGGEPPRL
jgi:hypothetical protein